MIKFISRFMFVLGMIIRTSSPQELELTETFPEIRKEGGYWLVKFYAPWCGHCKNLEPVWIQVSHILEKSKVQVRRVDCNRYPSVASEFGIRGYPTIKFITKDAEHTYNGDRNKEDIVNFALRMGGPAIEEITQSENLAYIKNVLRRLFFMYVGDKNDKLWKYYQYAASKWQPYNYFYSTSIDIAKQHLEIPFVPTVMVFKENTTYFFTDYEVDNEDENVNASLSNWINAERFDSFVKITRGNIHEILQTSKYIVLVVIEDSNSDVPNEMSWFKETVASFISQYEDKYHKHFQFGWVGNPEFANSIAMKVLPLPYLFVLNSTSYNYYVPDDDDVGKMTLEDIDMFLEEVYNQTLPALGGTGFGIQLYRIYFDSVMNVIDMWRKNPIATAVIFGLPCLFLFFICYCIYRIDVNHEEEEDEEQHNKID